MSAGLSNKDLHLPNLSIKGFRGIKDLSLPRLGRVTLFVGKNGVAKTTLLDAVRIMPHAAVIPFLRVYCGIAKDLLTLLMRMVTKDLPPIGRLSSMVGTPRQMPVSP